MTFVTYCHSFLKSCNDILGAVGKGVAIVAIGLMVVVIMIQVVFRYVLNAPLAWPDEAARFCMLWLTGLMAPVAFRQGGMIAITLFLQVLPRYLARPLAFILSLVSLLVLSVALQLGWDHVNSGWLFASTSLKVPLFLVGLPSIPIQLGWMYASLLVGYALLLLVNLEIMLRIALDQEPA